MADSLRPAVRQAVAPIGESVGSITVSNPSRTKGASLGAADKTAILSDTPLEVGPEATYEVRLTELDMETGACKMALKEDAENERVMGKITDPLFSIPNNPYALAMAGQYFASVRVKPVLKDGDLDRLFISDIFVPPTPPIS